MLHLAAIFNHTEIAELLLAAGADPTIPNSDKETAMDVAQPTLKRKMQAVREMDIYIYTLSLSVLSFICLAPL
jgi:ankyrin repeat protein